MIDVSFIIVNYFSEPFTCRCLDSILQRTQGLSFEIIVVDNQSGLKRETLPSDPRIRLLVNEKNLGYGMGCDAGARQAQGRYLYFLNNDIVFENDAASIQFRFMEAHPLSGLAGPRLVDSQGKHTPSFDYFPSLATKFLGTGFLRLFFPKRFPRRDGSVVVPTEVDLVSGSSLFMPSALYRQIDGFDPAYFLYCEEEDLALRVKAAGRAVYHLPEARLAHHGGGSSRQPAPLLRKEFYISYFAFYRKHYGRLRTSILMLFTAGQFAWRYLQGRDRFVWKTLLFWMARGSPTSESLRFSA